MKWKFRGDRPIYAQLIEQLERGILTGEYPPGSAIPSVRTLALEAEVNPNTMQRALAELETQGLLHTHRTAGRTVTEDRNMIERTKKNLAQTHVTMFFEDMRSIGIEEDEAAKLIAAAAKEAGKAGGGGSAAGGAGAGGAGAGAADAGGAGAGGTEAGAIEAGAAEAAAIGAGAAEAAAIEAGAAGAAGAGVADTGREVM